MNGIMRSASARERDPKFYNEVRQTNEDLIRYVEANQKISPYFDYTETFKSYIKLLEDLQKQYPPGHLFSSRRDEPPADIPTLKLPNDKPPLFSVAHKQQQPQQQQQQQQQPNTSNCLFGTKTNLAFGTQMNDFTKPAHDFGNRTLNDSDRTIDVVNSSSNDTNNTTVIDVTRLESRQTGDDTGAVTTTGTQEEDDAPPPEPNLDKYEESGAKFQCRCKLYERVMHKDGPPGKPTYVGCGELFVKEMDAPNKLHVIMRQDPDLRKVLMNQVITPNIPVKLSDRTVQILASSTDGEIKFYITKVRDVKTSGELFATLSSVRSA